MNNYQKFALGMRRLKQNFKDTTTAVRDLADILTTNVAPRPFYLWRERHIHHNHNINHH